MMINNTFVRFLFIYLWRQGEENKNDDEKL